MSNKSSEDLPSPWGSFLGEIDLALSEAVVLHCIGGFVIALLYGLPRPTGDVDYIAVIPRDRLQELQELAGRGSKLRAKYKVRLQHVTVATMPEGYETRLGEMFPGRFRKLKIFAPDPDDLVLSKLERNSPKGEGDVEYLARAAPLDPRILEKRYETELRPNLLARQSWHDGTL